MKSLKDALISPPVLALPGSAGHLILDTEACNVQVGCVLQQEQPDKVIQTIGYWSRSLTDAKRQYDTTQRECLAIVCAAHLLRP